jgi:hypothetical protein
MIGSFYRNNFNEDSVFKLDYCKTAVSCFLYIISWGLRMGGGIGDIMVSLDLYGENSQISNWVGKWIIEISFFMLINVISLNIIFGIIIDTFADLRDKESERVHD